MGIKGNEAAKPASITLSSSVPYSDLKLAVNSFIKEKWQGQWDGEFENKKNKTMHSNLANINPQEN